MSKCKFALTTLVLPYSDDDMKSSPYMGGKINFGQDTKGGKGIPAKEEFKGRLCGTIWN